MQKDDLRKLSFSNQNIDIPSKSTSLTHPSISPYVNCTDNTTLLGLMACGMSIVLYVSNGEVIAFLEKTEPRLTSPYQIIWISHVFQILALPPALIAIFKGANLWKEPQIVSQVSNEISNSGRSTSFGYLKNQHREESVFVALDQEPKQTKKDVCCAPLNNFVVVHGGESSIVFVARVLYLTIIYHLSAWLWAISLSQTGMTVGVTTAIFCSSPVFVFLISSILSIYDNCVINQDGNISRPRFKCSSDFGIQMIAVSLSMGGIALLSIRTEAAGASSFGIGALFSSLSAALYALFEVLYKRDLLQKQSNPPLSLAFLVVGIMGIVYLSVLWIPIPILSHFQIESIVRPPTNTQMALLCINGLLIAGFQLCLQLSLCLLPSPLLVSIASLLCMPAAQVSDWFLKTGHLTKPAIAGSALVGLSFIVMLAQETKKVEATELQVVEFNLKTKHGFKPYNPEAHEDDAAVLRAKRSMTSNMF
eukprot:GHVP01052515.1.p1 GENE.GHVP01052515.1~~GHVP01052515.1.p1  ORF type:complete len:477 (-),score=52.53 GHVP01052515.1:1733-3163(-)